MDAVGVLVTRGDPARVGELGQDRGDDVIRSHAIHCATGRADDAPVDGVPGCDRFVARVVRGIDATAESPEWMRRRLTEVGMRPISLAVDVTNYVMMLLGQPLHAYDLAKRSGAIEVRRARAGETLTTLDDVERTLVPEDLLITDGGTTPLAIAGVMGGATSEVDDTTTDVLVEAAHFDSVTVSRSARRHRLATEASKRFERGVDPAVTAAAVSAGSIWKTPNPSCGIVRPSLRETVPLRVTSNSAVSSRVEPKAPRRGCEVG